MTTTNEVDSVRQAALDHLWMHNADWTTMAEEGGPPIMVSGDGVRVTDAEGNVWIDAHGGYASVNAGYGHADIADAMLNQMQKLTYFPQGTTTVPLIRLVEKLGELAPDNLERVWPVSGGSEANETAVKIARAYHKRRGDNGRYKVISRRGSYHGATGGVMWMGASSGISDFEPAMPGMLYAPQPNFYRCEFGSNSPSECAERSARAVEELILLHSPDTVAAFIGEPVASGLALPASEYWQMVREICDRYGVLLIADEVVTGFGRTGKMFAMEHFDVVPDIMTVAKGITSSYLPLAATIAGAHVADAFAGEDNIFRQALTFGGHPVTAAVALKNIEIIEQNDLVSNSARMGSYFLEQLRELKVKHPSVGDVRGIGLLLGIELVSDRERKTPFDESLQVGKRLTEKMRSRGIIMRFNGGKVTLGPPLCITAEDINEIISALNGAISELETELPVG
jgi:adenosylmethionine-8-amino-7-oxononanoate aminotransferase